jgi:hypothetical protein
MSKPLFPVLLFALLLLSCNNTAPIIGKWRMTASKDITIHFIDDSTGSIESLHNNTPEKVRNFKYEIKNDTIFELTPAQFSQLRKWKIIKLDKDSLVICWDDITACYYRLP